MNDGRVATEEEPPSKRVALLDWDGSLHRGLTLRSWTHYLGERDVLPEAIVDAIEERFAATRATFPIAGWPSRRPNSTRGASAVSRRQSFKPMRGPTSTWT